MMAFFLMKSGLGQGHVSLQMYGVTLKNWNQVEMVSEDDLVFI